MKNCIMCGTGLDGSTTTWYRQKNYIHKCNDCIKIEKRDQASKWRSENKCESYNRQRIYKQNLKSSNPVKYTCSQMAASSAKRAKALGLDRDIDAAYLVGIAPERCPVFGTELKYGGGQKTKSSASLDRVDPSLGYTIGNVQIISNLANMMKNEATKEELIMFSEWVGTMRSHDKRHGVDTKQHS